jgi:hypothetical protein
MAGDTASKTAAPKDQESHAEAWIPAPRGEPANLGGGDTGSGEAKLPLEDQPQSKADEAPANKAHKDEVVVGSEESFPASDPPSYQPSTTSLKPKS